MRSSGNIRFLINGPEVVQIIPLEGDWATSLDLKSAFNHMLEGGGAAPVLRLYASRQILYICGKAVWGAAQSPEFYKTIKLRS
jgi:hypothetical protein